MNPLIAEFIGTAILSCSAMVSWPTWCCPAPKEIIPAGSLLPPAGGWPSLWECSVPQSFSGAHLNPAVTLAMAQAGKFAWTNVAGYMLAQMAGGIVGGTMVFLFYRQHFKASGDAMPTGLLLHRAQYPQPASSFLL